MIVSVRIPRHQNVKWIPADTVGGTNAEGMLVENCADVILARATIRGGPGHS